jgi:hypothetical protein
MNFKNLNNDFNNEEFDLYWYFHIFLTPIRKFCLNYKISFWTFEVILLYFGGSEKFICRTLDAEHCDLKWGVYDGDTADATAFVTSIKIATTYEDAISHASIFIYKIILKLK